jgi:hypothetical protein
MPSWFRPAPDPDPFRCHCDIYRSLDEHNAGVSEGPENAEAAAAVLAEARERYAAKTSS